MVDVINICIYIYINICHFVNQPLKRLYYTYLLEIICYICSKFVCDGILFGTQKCIRQFSLSVTTNEHLTAKKEKPGKASHIQ